MFSKHLVGAALGCRHVYHGLSVLKDLATMKEEKDVTKIIDRVEQKERDAGQSKGNWSVLADKAPFELDLECVPKVIKPTLCAQDTQEGWVTGNHPTRAT